VRLHENLLPSLFPREGRMKNLSAQVPTFKTQEQLYTYMMGDKRFW
jgi:hypothetical protein